MSFDHDPRHRVGFATLGIVAAGITVAAGFAATHPAAAASALARVQTTIACATTTPCVVLNNSSTGPGLTGTSTKGTAITGSGVNGISGTGSTGYGLNGYSKSSYGVYGLSSNFTAIKGISTNSYGLYGTSTSGIAGAAGTMNTAGGYGVYGFSTASSGGTGVYGSAVSGVGLYGTTTSGNGYGVVGNESGSGTGAYSSSNSGIGSEALSTTGSGLYAFSSSGTGVRAESNTGYAVIARSAGSVALYGTNSNGNGSDITGSYIGLLGRAPAATGYPLTLTDSASNNLMYVDGAGNISYKGGLFHFSRTAAGVVRSYGATATQPTVEDTGTAQLVAGSAMVRLDPAFRAAIDPTVAYRVFITPDGDTRGLFVASKAPGGFIVRETQGGRSTLAFDFRIVATAAGHAGQRMAITTDDAAFAPHAPLAVIDAHSSPKALAPLK